MSRVNKRKKSALLHALTPFVGTDPTRANLTAAWRGVGPLPAPYDAWAEWSAASDGHVGVIIRGCADDMPARGDAPPIERLLEAHVNAADDRCWQLRLEQSALDLLALLDSGWRRNVTLTFADGKGFAAVLEDSGGIERTVEGASWYRCAPTEGVAFRCGWDASYLHLLPGPATLTCYAANGMAPWVANIELAGAEAIYMLMPRYA